MFIKILIFIISCAFVLWLNTANADNENYAILDRSCSSIVCNNSIENTRFQYDKEESVVFSLEENSTMDKISSSIFVILENKDDKSHHIDAILDIVEVWEE
ncbi:hypothetical protein AB4086_23995 [Vibrio splendidus]